MIPLSVIVVNYRSVEFLKSCLASLSQTIPSTDSEVLVINNEVTLELARMLNPRWPNVQFLQNNANLGFAAGANLGFRKSHGEFVLILNPDVLAQDQAIETLLDTLKTNPEAAIALPRLSNPDGSLQYSCRRFYTYTTLLMRRTPFKRIFPNHPAVRNHLMLDWDHQSLAEVDWGLGAAMLVRRSAIRESCLFDERFFLYFEDVDLCLRMRRQGWKVIYNPAAILIHQHQRESADWNYLAKRHHFVSLIKFLWKYRLRL
jgi:N-acetylglucosaminyl-diphospho-decaprenol L-rhamnosyltransferase